MVKKPTEDDTFDDIIGGEAVEEERLHPILSNADVLKAREKARTRVDADRHAAAMKAIEDTEVERLRVEEGLTTGITDEDRIVSFTVDLPAYAANILINRRPYWHGHSYDVPIHLARTLADEQFKAWRHDDQIDGKSITQMYAQKRNTMINARSGAVSNAPARFDA